MAIERKFLGLLLFLLGAAATLAAYRFGCSTPVTGLTLTVPAMAAVLVVRGPRPRTKGTLLVAAELEPDALGRLLARQEPDTLALYRTEQVTAELLELQDRYGLVLVVGREHDPRTKERLSASGLSRQVPDIAEREVILAGPRHFQRYVRGALSRLSVPGAQVHTARTRSRRGKGMAYA